MRVALYARVSTNRQVQSQTIEQQLTRLQAHVEQQGWIVDEQHIYRDDGHSGAKLSRPGLDRLRDRVALAEIDMVVITASDRLARNAKACSSDVAYRRVGTAWLPGCVHRPTDE